MAKTSEEVLAIIRAYTQSVLGAAKRAVASDSDKLGGHTYAQVLQTAAAPTVSVRTGVTGAVTLDLAVANVFDITANGPVQFSLANIPSVPGRRIQFTLLVHKAAGAALVYTWFNNLKWTHPNEISGGGAPDEGQTFEYTFTSNDGSNWIGRLPS